MRVSLLIISMMVFCVTGCSHQKVYLFARYLTPDEAQIVKNNLSETGFDVETNQHYFPSTIKSNTLVHDFISDDMQIDNLIENLNHLNYLNVSAEIYAFSGKHYFTKGSIGLYLFPSQLSENYSDSNLASLAEKLFIQDLFGVFESSSNCSKNSYLLLNNDKSFVLSQSDALTSETFKMYKHPTGKWYLEQERLTLIYLDDTPNQQFVVSNHSQNIGQFLQNKQLLTPVGPVNAANNNQQNCIFQKSLMEV